MSVKIHLIIKISEHFAHQSFATAFSNCIEPKVRLIYDRMYLRMFESGLITAAIELVAKHNPILRGTDGAKCLDVKQHQMGMSHNITIILADFDFVLRILLTAIGFCYLICLFEIWVASY